MAAAAGAQHRWPGKLVEKQGLELQRGEVVWLDGLLFAVVAYDGRDECYLCWRGDEQGDFHVDKLVSIPRRKAHAAPRDRFSSGRVPPLPPVGHTGRLASERGMPRQRPLSLQIAAQDRRPSGSSGQSAMLVSEPAHRRHSGSSGQSAMLVSEPAPPSTSPRSERGRRAPRVRSGTGGLFDEELRLDRAHEPLPLKPHPQRLVPVDAQLKSCSVCTALKALAQVASAGLAHLADALDHISGEPGTRFEDLEDEGYLPAEVGQQQQQLQGEPPVDPQLRQASAQLRRGRVIDLSADRACSDQEGDDSSASSAPLRKRSDSRRAISPAWLSQGTEQALSENVQRNAFTDLQIEIPIVKPASWDQVMPLVEGCCIAFDERGVKETMTVRTSRWNDFVDRQKAKLELEIQEAQRLIAKRDEEGNLSDWDHEGAISCTEQDEDIEELVQLASRMDDWKDLCRYSGKSISMASTKHGNEMKIHVMAFAERDDGTGVDFMRVSYKKSVEVKWCPDDQSGWSTLRMVLPFLRPVQHTEVAQAKEGWIQLLQRPDMAKFIIAKAFRKALANDGVLLKFVEARFDDEEL